MEEQINTLKDKTNKTILVIDDDQPVLQLLCTLLENNGYSVVGCLDGESGWEKYKEIKPDLILLDVFMPGLDGRVLLRQIRNVDASTPVIMETAANDSGLIIEILNSGAQRCITKPFTLDLVVKEVEDVLFSRSLVLENHRLERVASLLKEENKNLKEKIKTLQETRGSEKVDKDDIDKYKAISGAVTHSLKGEFLHIGNSVKELRELADSSPEIQEECDIIERSAEHSQLLLRRLLDYLDLGKPRVEPVGVLSLLPKIELLVKPRLPSSIQFEVIVDKDVKGLTVSTDAEQLIGVLVELINNAANVLRENGGIIALKVERENDKIAISVRDDGPGIPEEIKEDLFQKEISSKNGLGMGLFLSKKVIDELGGSLELISSSNEGTMFTVQLPMSGE